MDETFAFSPDMLTYEMYEVIVWESLVTFVCSIIAAFIVVLVITGHVTAGLIVLCAVVVTHIFLGALVPLLGLDYNNKVNMHILASIGISCL